MKIIEGLENLGIFEDGTIFSFTSCKPLKHSIHMLLSTLQQSSKRRKKMTERYESLIARIRYHILKANFMGLKEHEGTLLLKEAADAIEGLLAYCNNQAEPDCTTCPVKGKACKVFYRDKGDNSVCRELREAEGEDDNPE